MSDLEPEPPPDAAPRLDHLGLPIPEREPTGRASRRNGKPKGRPKGVPLDRLRDPTAREPNGKKSRRHQDHTAEATQVPGDWSFVSKDDAHKLKSAMADQRQDSIYGANEGILPVRSVLRAPTVDLDRKGASTDAERPEERAICDMLKATALPSLDPPDVVAKAAYDLVSALYRGELKDGYDFKKLENRVRVNAVQRMLQLSQETPKDKKVPYLAATDLLNISDRLEKHGVGGVPGTIDQLQGGVNGLTEL